MSNPFVHGICLDSLWCAGLVKNKIFGISDTCREKNIYFFGFFISGLAIPLARRVLAGIVPALPRPWYRPADRLRRVFTHYATACASAAPLPSCFIAFVDAN